MKVVPLEQTTLTVIELAEMVQGGSVILTRNGQPVMEVKALSGIDRESVALTQNPRFTALIEDSRDAYRQTGGVGLDDLRQELGLEPKP
jgi:hypothetical protein